MSGAFDWSTAKPYQIYFDYNLPDGHTIHRDADGNVSLLTVYWLPIEDCPGVSAGVLRVLVELYGDTSVFVSVDSPTGRVDLPASAIATDDIWGPGFAYHPVPANQYADK